MINDEHLLMPNRWQTYIGIMTESTVYKNQRWFSIYIPEFVPTHTGDVQPDYEDEDATVTNVWSGKPKTEEGKTENQLTGVSDGGSVHVTKTVRADYWGWSTCEDVPTMYRDMQVLVINYANTDRWFWIPLERDRAYKTFEHIRISANNQAVTNKEERITAEDKTQIFKRNTSLNDGNQYFIEIDTKYAKHIKICTCHSDGEKWDYTIEINALKQFIEIHDKAVDGSQPNNTIKIESKPNSEEKGRITLQNASMTTFLLAGEDMAIHVPRNLTLNVGGDFIKKIDGNVSEITGQSHTNTIVGPESTTVGGLVNHLYLDNVVEGVCKNKTDVVLGQHSEKQAARQTISGVATWISAKSWTVGSAMIMTKSEKLCSSAYTGIFTFKSLVVTAFTTVQIYGTTLLGVASRIMCCIPFHAVLPMVPVISHTMII